MFVKESVGFFLLRITGRGKYRFLIIAIMGTAPIPTRNMTCSDALQSFWPFTPLPVSSR